MPTEMTITKAVIILDRLNTTERIDVARDNLAEAPADITLVQLLKLADKINPDYCACGICTYSKERVSEEEPPEIIFGYDSVKKANDDVACWISGEEAEVSE